MFAASSLLAILFLALTVSANPIVIRDSPVKLPLARRLNLTSVHNLVRHDLARAKHLRARAEALSKGVSPHVLSSDATIDESADNQAVDYIASVGVGSPATTYELIIDTGSSNTWIGAGKSYTPTSTSSETSDSVTVSYGSGIFTGIEYIDEITIAPGLVIPRQSIGVASSSIGFSGTDGILG
ncbi:hypothetical protein C0992_005245 [Termitomyces sp. T32_za158]|nr:hypothetical protein C0992_005245 [Termitomyces sp. T32_za158]